MNLNTKVQLAHQIVLYTLSSLQKETEHKLAQALQSGEEHEAALLYSLLHKTPSSLPAQTEELAALTLAIAEELGDRRAESSVRAAISLALAS